VRDAEQLAVPMPTLAVWRTGICMAPYIRALKQTRPVIVALLDARRARVWRYVAGTLWPPEEIHAHAVTEAPSHMGDAPRLGFHSGTRGMAAHDAAQRSLAQGTERMIADAARRAISLAGQDGWLIAGGIPEVSAKLIHALRNVAPRRVLLLKSLDVHSSEAQVTAAAEDGASQLRDQTDLRHVSEIAGDADGKATLGLTATLEALGQSRVRLLFVTQAFIEQHLSEAEDAVRAAIAQNAQVEHVSRTVADRLDELGGIGALLRYPRAPNASEASDAAAEHETAKV
jgi:hypothetical protein